MTKPFALEDKGRPHAKFDSYDDDHYFNLRGLAEYSSISVRTLRDYLASARDPLPCYSVKKKILVKKSEFDAWLKKYQVRHKPITAVIDEVLADVLVP